MGDNGTPPDKRRWAFSLIVTVAGLAALEGGLRAVGAAVRHHQTHRAASVRGDGGPVVLAVGDSVTQGVPEGRAHGWPAHFAEQTGATVHNLGAAGRGVEWLVADLDRRTPAIPTVDLVIAMVGHNDCAYLEDLASIHMPEPPTALEAIRRSLRQLALYRVMLQVVARGQRQTRAEVTDMPRPMDGSRQADFCRAAVETGVAALVDRARRWNAELVVASYPLSPRKDTQGLRVNRLVDTLLEASALAHGLRFADTRPCFLDAPQTDWQQDGVHLTRSGYARLGGCLARAVELVP